MYNPFSLNGKTILVTGASSGIGKSISIECSKMGANLILLGRDKERLNETFGELDEGNHQIHSVDLTSKQEIVDLVNVLPTLDGLVNAAGILKTMPFHFINEDSLNQVMNINFFAPLWLSKQLISKKKIAKGGSIVFVSSISGSFCSYIGNSIYSSSKGAIDSLSKNMALELAHKKIRVNTLNPGMVETNMHIQNTITPDQLIKDMEAYPLKRYGKPEDVAYAAIYLLSDASAWITGTNLLIDGGYTLQ